MTRTAAVSASPVVVGAAAGASAKGPGSHALKAL